MADTNGKAIRATAQGYAMALAKRKFAPEIWRTMPIAIRMRYAKITPNLLALARINITRASAASVGKAEAPEISQ